MWMYFALCLATSVFHSPFNRNFIIYKIVHKKSTITNSDGAFYVFLEIEYTGFEPTHRKKPINTRFIGNLIVLKSTVTVLSTVLCLKLGTVIHILIFYKEAYTYINFL